MLLTNPFGKLRSRSRSRAPRRLLSVEPLEARHMLSAVPIVAFDMVGC